MRFLKRLFSGRDGRSAAVRFAAEWERRASALAGELKAESARLEATLALVEDLAGRASDRLAQAREMVQQHESVVNGLREEIKVLEECTVPALVAANNRLTERWKAETEIEVMRRVAAQPQNGRGQDLP